MDLQSSQNNCRDEDRLQTSESLLGFFSRMTVSNKTMERIMRQDSNLSPYDGFRIGGIGKVLNQIGLNQRKHHIIYKPVVGRYEGMLEIAGHEILVTGVAGRENGSMILGISFLEDHKPWGRKWNAYIDSGSGICTAKPRVFPKEARETLPESEKEIKNLKEALVELKTKDISEKSKLSLENVKRLIQRNFSENPLAWWDRNKIETTLKIKEECKYEYVRYKPIQMNMEDKKDMQMIIKEHINLGLIEPGISAYSSPGFLETESAKWKWEEIHTQRVRELKQICNNLPKLAIPQDEDELVVYTDANDYRWAAVLMKKTTTGEEPCRYTGGLFTEQQAQVWHINEKEFFAVWKAFKKWPLFLLAKEFTLKIDNTNIS
ncbi:hypothetical protein Sango_0815600 [Sesamum angolense]|uniref:Reverse transcriptase/retrotransposon-derived protein RNase H-like domain-containing protein n=1 Tax=Sesamum angolense TaxID=2727404 RepID=A0AAE1X3A2_9LAMI|nr:hypothetical protein Sango_0815600 [Sesamum angolense]